MHNNEQLMPRQSRTVQPYHLCLLDMAQCSIGAIYRRQLLSLSFSFVFFFLAGLYMAHLNQSIERGAAEFSPTE
jgi:hypothetical protein